MLCFSPILRIPNLAIHLNREVNEKGFAPNKQTHVLPVIATAIKSELGAKEEKKDSNNASAVNPPATDGHHSVLVSILADELGVEVSAIRDFELSLYDTQPSVLGGAYNEFIFARGLDNLVRAQNVHCACRSLYLCTLFHALFPACMSWAVFMIDDELCVPALPDRQCHC